ncbi:MAG TPA: TonB-dependent receptor, partial [Steroidobacteraceae bacterium]|nr:TonB-dependent receptor [Steroidobacteraceae bacterium]
KSASDTPGWLVNLTSGNEDKALITARYGGTAGNDVRWRAYGKYLSRDPHRTPLDANADDGWSAWRGGFRADWIPNNQEDTLTLQGDLYSSDSGQMRSTPQLAAPYAVIEKEHISSFGGNLLGRWSRELGNESRFSIQSYLDITSRDQFTLNVRRTTFDFDAQYELPSFGRQKIIVGANYRDSIDHMSFTPVITASKSTNAQQVFSGFFQDKITLETQKWFLTLGSKFEHNDFTGFEIQPNARLQWIDGEEQTAWSSIARAVRTPSELEHDLTILAGVIPPSVLPVPVSIILQPSPSFASEQLVAYEIGYRRQWTPSVLMDVSAFYNDYDKLATLSLLAPGLGFPPLHLIQPIGTTNNTRAKTYGFEAVANWRASEAVKLSLAYSMLNMQLDGPPGNIAIDSEGAKGQSPKHQINTRMQWDVSKRVALDTAIYYVDALPAYGVSSYWRLDVRLGWRLTEKLQLDVVGQNLLADSHREFGAIGEANAVVIGRTIYGKLLWRP